MCKLLAIDYRLNVLLRLAVESGGVVEWWVGGWLSLSQEIGLWKIITSFHKEKLNILLVGFSIINPMFNRHIL